MSTYLRRFSVRILVSLLVFSLAYTPVALLPQLGVQDVYAQGEGGQNGSGGGSSGGGNASIDNAGIDSSGNLDSGAFGINSNGQVVDSRGQVVDLSSGVVSIGPFAIAGTFSGIPGLGFLGGLIDRALGLSIVEVDLGTLGQGLNALDRAVNDAVGSLAGAFSGNSATAGATQEAGTLSVELGINGEVEVQTDRDIDGDGENDSEVSEVNVLDDANVETWGDYVDQENAQSAQEGDLQSVSLSSSADTVEMGQGVTLEWASDRGSACYSQGYGWTAVREANGSVRVENITSDQVFLIRCVRIIETPASNDNGQSTIERREGMAYAEVRVRNATSTASTTPGRPQTVQPQPVQMAGASSDSAQGLSISIFPGSISLGGQATLSWFAEGNRSCSLTGGWPGAAAEGAARAGRDASAVSRVNPSQTTTYGISCVGVDGVSRSVSATVNVR